CTLIDIMHPQSIDFNVVRSEGKIGQIDEPFVGSADNCHMNKRRSQPKRTGCKGKTACSFHAPFDSKRSLRLSREETVRCQFEHFGDSPGLNSLPALPGYHCRATGRVLSGFLKPHRLSLSP